MNVRVFKLLQKVTTAMIVFMSSIQRKFVSMSITGNTNLRSMTHGVSKQQEDSQSHFSFVLTFSFIYVPVELR